MDAPLDPLVHPDPTHPARLYRWIRRAVLSLVRTFFRVSVTGVGFGFAVAQWTNGETRFSTIEGEQLKLWLKKYRLGEMLRSGELEALA